MKINNKGLSLMEVLIAIFILVAALGALATIYPGIFRGVNLDAQSLKAWQIAQEEIETLKNTSFDTLYSVSYNPQDAPTVNAFSTGDVSIKGFYYVQQMLDKDNNVLLDLVRLEVVICFRTGNSVVGEDTNLNGVFDAGEDTDSNGKVSSGVRLTTLVFKPI